MSGFQFYQGVQLSTGGTGFGSRFPPVNVDNLLIVLLCLMLKFQMERIGCDVRYLSSPQAFHSLKGEGFKHQHIVRQHKMLGKFPMMVFTLSAYLAMRPSHVFSSTFAIVATTLLFGMRAVCTCNLVATAFIEFGRLVFGAITAGEHCFDAKVKPGFRFTSLGCGFGCNVVRDNSEIRIAECVEFDGDGFHYRVSDAID